MGLGPIPAVKKALKKAGVSLQDIGLIELNEALPPRRLPAFVNSSSTWRRQI